MRIAEYNIGLNAQKSRMFEESFEFNKKQEVVDISSKSQLELERVGENYSYSKDEMEFEKKVLVKTLEKFYSFNSKQKEIDEQVKSEKIYDKVTLKWDRGALFDSRDSINKYEVHKKHKIAESQRLEFEAKGVVLSSDGKEINFDINLNLSRDFIGKSSIKAEFLDPLVINFDTTSIKLSDKKFSFDIDNSGFSSQISYLGKGSGFLALDKNSNNVIDNGSELFGTESGDGFGDLAKYDDDQNGFIDENDKIFDKLRIWRKGEGEDKLIALGEVGIGAIYLGSAKAEYLIKNDDNKTLAKINQTGIAIKESGDIVTMQSVDFAIDRKENIKPSKTLEEQMSSIDSMTMFGGVFNQSEDGEVDITQRLTNPAIRDNALDEIIENFKNGESFKFSGFSNEAKVKNETKDDKIELNTTLSDEAKAVVSKNEPKVSELKSKQSRAQNDLNSFQAKLKGAKNSMEQMLYEQDVAKSNAKLSYIKSQIQVIKTEEFLAYTR